MIVGKVGIRKKKKNKDIICGSKDIKKWRKIMKEILNLLSLKHVPWT